MATHEFILDLRAEWKDISINVHTLISPSSVSEGLCKISSRLFSRYACFLEKYAGIKSVMLESILMKD